MIALELKCAQPCTDTDRLKVYQLGAGDDQLALKVIEDDLDNVVFLSLHDQRELMVTLACHLHSRGMLI